MDKLNRGDNLSILVLERIVQSILSKKILPGDLLPSEREIMEEYGVGKSSVREAVKMLQVMGVVECFQGKKTHIRKSFLGTQILQPLLYDLMLQQSTSEELYEFRVMFETAYLEIAILKATEDDKKVAKQKFIEYKSLYEANLPFASADIAFHKAILDATRNQFVVKTGLLILSLCDPYLQGSELLYDSAVMDSHERMLDAFCSGDTSNLKEIVEGVTAIFKKVLDTKYKNKDE